MIFIKISMANLYVLLLLLTCICACACAPLEEKQPTQQHQHQQLKEQKQIQLKSSETDPELTTGYYEGDIVLVSARNGVRDTHELWPNAVVYYKITDHFDDAHVQQIQRAMEIIESMSCIRFKVANTNNEFYINITGISDGCYSTVGFKNKPQTLNLKNFPLDTGCFKLGKILHEFFHALGFYHMQSAAERDDYVRIAEENIIDDKIQFFSKKSVQMVDNFDMEYDYASIMHYNPFAFSKNGERTIIALHASEAAQQMGQRLHLTQTDITKLNTMYRCPKKI